jgi:hypothetical protein
MSLTWGHHSDIEHVNAHMRKQRKRRTGRPWWRWLRLPDFGDM